ncbi:MAG: SDR family oxidoreductase [Clostridiaceae bacterium]|nr:SDR family oxidoreductase [Clostridiaceae bacterium]
MNDTYFQDQVAVVTGAGGTLCSVIACDLAERGARVALVGRTPAKLQVVADKITAAGGNCRIASCDVTDERGMQQLADELLADWGPCRFLVNGAGGNNIKAMTTLTAFDASELGDARPEGQVGFFDLDMEMFEQVLNTNTLGTVIPSRVFGRQMASAGGGSIVNFASMNSYCPLTRVPAYAMAKAAVVNLTEWLAAYLAAANIRVNAVAPGFFVNARSVQYLGSVQSGLTPRGQKVIDHTPMGRFGEAKDLLGCVAWLLDDRASGFITGATIPVDGGFLTRSGV